MTDLGIRSLERLYEILIIDIAILSSLQVVKSDKCNFRCTTSILHCAINYSTRKKHCVGKKTKN